MLPVPTEKEAPIADGFVDSEWSTNAEPMTNAGWHLGLKDPVAA